MIAQIVKEHKEIYLDSSRLFWEMMIEGLPKSVQPQVKTLHPPDQERKFDGLVKTLRSLQSSEPKPSGSAAPMPSGATSPQKSPKKQPYSPKKGATADGKKGDDQAAKPRELLCYHCKEPGHARWECPKLAALRAQRMAAKKGGGPERKERKDGVHVVHVEPQDGKRFVVARLTRRDGREVSVLALPDTGADVSVITPTVAAKLAKRAKWLPVSGVKLQVLDGRETPVLGKLSAQCRLANDVSIDCCFHVTESAHECVLGLNVLKQLKAFVGVHVGEVRLPTGTLKMVDDKLPATEIELPKLSPMAKEHVGDDEDEASVPDLVGSDDEGDMPELVGSDEMTTQERGNSKRKKKRLGRPGMVAEASARPAEKKPEVPIEVDRPVS